MLIFHSQSICRSYITEGPKVSVSLKTRRFTKSTDVWKLTLGRFLKQSWNIILYHSQSILHNRFADLRYLKVPKCQFRLIDFSKPETKNAFCLKQCYFCELENSGCGFSRDVEKTHYFYSEVNIRIELI